MLDYPHVVCYTVDRTNNTKGEFKMTNQNTCKDFCCECDDSSDYVCKVCGKGYCMDCGLTKAVLEVAVAIKSTKELKGYIEKELDKL